jgi:type VI secretion system protein
VPRELTVLERLRRGDAARASSSVEDVDLLVRSIEANLTRLLNAREGSSLARPDYGMPAPSEIVHAFPRAVTRVQTHVTNLLVRFEPRLCDVEVTHLEDAQDKLSLRFQIQARLATSPSAMWVSYALRFDPSGRVTLRR